MAETWDREFFDIRDTEQPAVSVSVIEADANGVRDVGQAAESPQTVGEYMASLPVVQPEVQEVPGVKFSEQEQPGPVDVFAMQSETPDFTASTDVDMTGYEWPEAVTPEVPSDTMSLPKAGVELPRRLQLRQEQQRRQAARANIRQLSKTDPRGGAEAASAERIERHRRQEWDDTLPFPEPQGIAAEVAEGPGGEPQVEPDTEQQRELVRVASRTRTPSELGSSDPWNMQMPFGGGGDEVTAILRDMLTELKNLVSKLDLDSRWGV